MAAAQVALSSKNALDAMSLDQAEIASVKHAGCFFAGE